jgi:lysozyme family protein
MANFDYAIDATLKNEGGEKYTEINGDSGGATKFGISLSWYRGKVDPRATRDTIKALTEDNAKSLYKKYFWDDPKIFMISNQAIASKIFDIGVNTGPSQSIKLAQRALFSLYGLNCVNDDGVLGQLTISKINSVETDRNAYLCSLKTAYADFYRMLASKEHNNRQFLNGWLKRAYD